MPQRPLLVRVLFLCVLPAALAAQTPPPRVGPRPAVGAEVGYSRSNLGGPDATKLRSRQGALTGVFLQVPVAGPLSVRPEILFALKGGRAQIALEGGGTAQLEIDLAYLELPVLLRGTVARGRFRPTLFGGPAPALKIGCDLRRIVPDSPVRESCDQVDFIAFRGFDVGLVMGGGLEVRWPQSALALEARYNTGFRSLIKGSDVRSRTFGIMLALTF
jgi:hypothetical protein